MADAIIKSHQLTKDQRDMIRMLYRAAKIIIDDPFFCEDDKLSFVGKRQLLEQLFGEDFFYIIHN